MFIDSLCERERETDRQTDRQTEIKRSRRRIKNPCARYSYKQGYF